MSNQISVLKQTELCGQQFVVYGSVQEPFFFAQDVAVMLQLTNVSDMVQRVDEDERSKFNLGRQGDGWFLTENGLYEVLMQSRKPIAKQFKKGVKAILKEIRTNGGYIATHQDDTPELIMARALQVAQATITKHQQMLEQANERIALQEKEIKAQAPKVSYYDQTLQSVNTLTTTQVAKSIGMETHTLTKKLKEAGIIFKQSGMWMLHAPYSKWKLHATRTSSYTRSDGTTGTNQYTVWTERGRRFIVALADNDFNTSKAVKAIQAA